MFGSQLVIGPTRNQFGFNSPPPLVVCQAQLDALGGHPGVSDSALGGHPGVSDSALGALSPLPGGTAGGWAGLCCRKAVCRWFPSSRCSMDDDCYHVASLTHPGHGSDIDGERLSEPLLPKGLCCSIAGNRPGQVCGGPAPTGQPSAGLDMFRERLSEPLLPKGLCCFTATKVTTSVRCVPTCILLFTGAPGPPASPLPDWVSRTALGTSVAERPLLFHCQKLLSNIYLVISRRPRPNGQPVAGPDTFRERFSELLLPKGLCCPMAKARP